MLLIINNKMPLKYLFLIINLCTIILSSQICDTPMIVPISCLTLNPNSSLNNGSLIALSDLAGDFCPDSEVLWYCCFNYSYN